MVNGTRIITPLANSDEAALLMGFLCAKAVESPRDKATARATTSRPNNINFQLKFIASNLSKIKHWKIVQGDYLDIENQEATWYIDPPYKNGGQVYPANTGINYTELAEWCKNRRGQIIVCENMSANWLPFLPLRKMRGSKKTTTEAIWSNYPTQYDHVQMDMKL